MWTNVKSQQHCGSDPVYPLFSLFSFGGGPLVDPTEVPNIVQEDRWKVLVKYYCKKFLIKNFM